MSATLRRAVAQCVKELEQFLRDPLSVGLSFLLPFIMMLIFGFAIRLEAHDLPLAVVDQDRTDLSRTIVERLVATNVFHLVAVDPARLERVLDDGSARGAIVIPPQTQQSFQSNRSATIQAVIDGADVVNAQIIKNYAQATAASIAAAGRPKVRPEVRLWFNPGRREALYIVPGVYAIVLGLFPAMLVAIGVARDREEGTLLQVYVSAMSAFEYLSGKVAAYVAVGLVQAILLFTAGALLWGLVPRGDPTPLLVCTPLFLTAIVSLGLMVGARTTTQSAAVQAVATVSNLPAVLFTGFLYPLENIPWPLSLISNLVPARYFIGVTRDVFVRGSGWLGVWPAVPALAGLALLFFGVAWLTSRKMQLRA